MELNVKNEFDSISQLWQRRINSYNLKRDNTRKVALALWGALLFLLYGIFVERQGINFQSAHPSIFSKYTEFAIALVFTVIVIWGASIWWFSNNALSMVVDRLLANFFEEKLQSLIQFDIHPLDRKFMKLYKKSKNKGSCWIPGS